jgi:hypothetical protein
MGVDSGYGTGTPRSASNSASRRNAARAANNRRRTIRSAGRRIGNTATATLKPLSGTSEYIVRENAARAQLGVSGQASRYRQLPTAARATARGLVREITGVDVSRKGIKADPFSVAMAWGPGKIAKFGKIAGSLRAAANASDNLNAAGRAIAAQSGRGPVAVGNLTRNLDQGSMQISRSFEGAFEAVADRVAAAERGRAISRIMAQNGLRSVPNTIAAAGKGGRDVYRPVQAAEIGSRPAEGLRQAGFDVGALYPSGMPAGGWVRSPNLRTRRPVPVEYSNSGDQFFTAGLTQSQREASSTIASMLDDATVRRNLSAGMKYGGDYYFPRTWQPSFFARATPGSDMVPRVAGRLDPAEYKFKAANWILKQVRQKRFLK